MRLDASTSEGHYARKQLFCKSRLISWSHRGRFETGLRFARRFAGKQVLDYGCGDGTFLAILMQGSGAPASAVGAEIALDLVRDCESRHGNLSNLRFLLVDALDAPEQHGAYDGVICMDVLEHVVDWTPVLDRLTALLAPHGRLVVSVPVETGPVLPVKQLVRRFAGWRGLGDYPGTTPYRMREMLAGLFAGREQHIQRPIHRGNDGSVFHDHKGFNWRVLRAALSERLPIEQTVGSPLGWLPPGLGSQVWFVAGPKQPA